MKSDAEIIAAIEQEEALALDTASGELVQQRTDALARYRGEPLGNEQEGRSQVVDKSVLDTIEWIMPSLVRIYLGGDEIGHFDPIGPEDEAAAKAETEACNWYINQKNDSFSHFNSTLRDALLLKNGYVVAYWKVDKSVVTETYKGLADEELALIQQDKCVEVIEHSDYPDPYAMPMPQGPPGQPPGPPPPPPMLHDVKIQRVKPEEYVAIESVPPEELLVARRHRWTSLRDCDFIQWRRKTTIGQLRAEGFDIPDDAPGYIDFSGEAMERARYHETDRYYDETTDPTRKVVQFRDTYMLMDIRGSGTPQLWRFCYLAGTTTQLILKDEADLIPFAAFTPIIYPHSHIGTAIYDLINDLSLIKTTLMRNYLDGVYQQQSNQKVVNVDAGVNLDDLLVSRPGNIIRCSGDPNQAVVPLQITDITGSVLQGIQYIDQVKQDRVGVDRNSMGLDPNTLNRSTTATAIQAQQSAVGQRLELIARTLAGGFRDLFLIVHALALKHSTKPLQMRLHNQWVTVNPREWATRTDFSISVGMGTGAPEIQMQKISMMAPMVEQWMHLGLAGPREVYNLSTEFIKAAGWRNPDKFIHEPAKDPQTGQDAPPPQQPDPMIQAEQIKAQSAQQIAQGKAQTDMQAEQLRAQTTQAAEQARAQADVAVQQHKIATSNALELEKFQRQLVADDIRHQREQQTQLQLANIKASNALEVARVSSGIDDGLVVLKQELLDAGQNNASALIGAVQQMGTMFNAVAQAAAAPKEILRGPDGRAIGIRAINKH